MQKLASPNTRLDFFYFISHDERCTKFSISITAISFGKIDKYSTMAKKRAHESFDSLEKKQKTHSYNEKPYDRSNGSNPSHRNSTSSSANLFNRPESSGHQSNKPLRNHRAPDSHLTASLSQQVSEVTTNPTKENVYALIKEKDVDEAALNLGQVLHSEQSTGSNSLKDDSSRSKKVSKSRHVSNSPSQPNQAPTVYPDLPPILDSSLENVPFTHAGTIQGKPGTSVASYDRLEFVGDAYIELMATRLIYSLYPQLSVGRWSQIRESLVRNDTLAEFSLAYGFDERAQVPRSHKDPAVRTRNQSEGNKVWKDSEGRKLWTKMLGDIFEAYVAAVILSDPLQGFNTVEAWLTNLWSFKLQGEDNINNLPLDTGAKQDLARKVLGRGIKLEYRDEAVPEMIKYEGKIWYTIGAYLTGWGWENQHLGSGKGLNKSEAGNRAAMQALRNPLTAQIGAVKRDFDAKAKLEKEQQSSNTGTEESQVGDTEKSGDLDVKSEESRG